MIEFHTVTKSFDRFTAIDDVSFSIEAGQIVGIVGPNGCGKTTTFRLLAAYFPPSRGTVRVAGLDTTVASLAVRRRVGYALEGVLLYPELTVDDFLSFAATLKRATRAQKSAVVDLCGLAPWLRHRIATLSKGFRQRVVLGQALLADPPVLILDEPTVGMDPEMAVNVRQWLRSLSGSRTVLLSTHSLSEAQQVCQRLLVLHQGRLVADGAPTELFPEEGLSLENAFLRLLACTPREQSYGSPSSRAAHDV